MDNGKRKKRKKLIISRKGIFLFIENFKKKKYNNGVF